MEEQIEIANIAASVLNAGLDGELIGADLRAKSLVRNAVDDINAGLHGDALRHLAAAVFILCDADTPYELRD